MPTVVAKCHNYTGCLQAYRGEEVTLDAGAALVCPECGKPMALVKGGASTALGYVALIAVAVALVAGAWFAFPLLKSFVGSTGGAAGSDQPVSSANPRGSSAPAGAGSNVQPAEPPATITPPARIDLDPANAENKRVRDEVLTRIDLMPKVSQANKDKLYNSVDRARSMGLVLTIPFASGKMALSPAEVQTLKTELEKPEIMRIRDDPTAVFVVLGYADPKGDQKKNIEISQSRADALLIAMRDKCGVNNVMHAVAMGGSTLHDARALEKNRVVEVWAALP